MEEKYIEIFFEGVSREQGEIIVATLNHLMEPEGFEEGDGFVKAYIPASKFNPGVLEQFRLSVPLKYKQTAIENRNWNAIWESEFELVIIDKFISIRADFHIPVSNVEYEIIITPKMSFGTGHHATTTLMLESLRHFSCAGKTVVDFGTGTGILAILAHKMKAEKVLAIDHDEWSMENALENLERNDAHAIRLLKEDHFPVSDRWDMILANINLQVILDNMNAFYHGLNSGGVLIISGILETDRNQVEEVAKPMGFTAEYFTEKNNWVCVAFKKKSLA